MALTDLDAMISEANENKANLYSLFLDMEKAFSRVWTHHFVSMLHHKAGLQDSLPIFLRSFLQECMFHARKAGHLSYS